jgi:hypothetical protein
MKINAMVRVSPFQGLMNGGVMHPRACTLGCAVSRRWRFRSYRPEACQVYHAGSVAEGMGLTQQMPFGCGCNLR